MTNRLFAAAVGLLLSFAAHASSPVTLWYSVKQQDDGRFRYRFTLRLTDEDQSWQAGHGFGWLVISDGSGNQSLLHDFAGDSATISGGPWRGFCSTAGFNNGPTLGDIYLAWYPSAIGETISWEGTSSVHLSGNQLRWSMLECPGRDLPIENETALFESKCGPADMDQDGYITGDDFDLFDQYYAAGDSRADLDQNGFVGPDDWEAYLIAFASGC